VKDDEATSKQAAQIGANWHAGWAAALGMGALLCIEAGGASSLALALTLAAGPGALGQLLRFTRGPFAAALLAVTWPLAIAAALWLSGGAASPLMPLALGPAIAMAAFEARRMTALTAALTVGLVAAVALAPVAGWPALAAAGGPWASVLALATVGVGLAAVLLITHARSNARQTALGREIERLRDLLESAPALMLQLDGEGIAREAFSGAPQEAGRGLIGQPLEKLACEAHRPAIADALAVLHRTGSASVGFAPPLAPDRWLTAELRALPEGGAVALVRDASFEQAQLASLEHARQEAESAARAKSRFLANMSHELRTPLNAIIGFSDIMRSRLFGPLPERYAEYANLIHESGGHLLDLISDLLDVSKIEAERFTLTLEAFDAREAVSGALRLTRVQADAAKIALRGALPAEPLEVEADRRALKQIVLNLVSNALKFTSSGGQVNVLARRRGDSLEIIVADTGVGIAPEDLERLGRPYEQAGAPEQRALGVGLGLSLVRAFAELHGGTMTLKSVLGEGTAVTVRLPVMLTAARRASEEEPPPARTGTHGNNVIAFAPLREGRS
jgi:cell cycle sensor histidine kinase DivJ